MRRIIDIRLHASTLAELLVLMIVAGVVFLAVMDGLGVARRYFDRVADRIGSGQAQYEGYCRIESLAGRADSMTREADAVALWIPGEDPIRLTICDSALIVVTGNLRDTLLHPVAWPAYDEASGTVRIDTLAFVLREKDRTLTLRMATPQRPNERQRALLTEQENEYRYEEE
ncbi:MAG: hypothetical protein IJC16_07750 [Rikenellaceae bacterium]|nr:hypothetical protein [Rikenellaceae bacterium]